MNLRLNPLLGWITSILTIIVVLLLGIRIVLNPAYPQLAYSLPGFPEDSYGFTTDERLHWAPIAIDYLLNDAGPEFLGDLTFPNGSPLYNEREVSHMLDVKILVQQVLRVFYICLALLLALGLWAWYGGWWRDFRFGVSRGGWMAVYLIFGVGLFAAVSFWQFFTYFHKIFFTGDTWLFYYSDTLIRLFPMRFWSDVSIFAFGIALLSGVALGYFMKPRAV